MKTEGKINGSPTRHGMKPQLLTSEQVNAMTEMSLHRMPFPEQRLKTREQILNEKYKEFSNSGLPFTKENGLKWQLEAMREYAEQLLNSAADISETSVRPAQRIKALINHEQYKRQ